VTNEQLKAIALAIMDIGDSMKAIGESCHEIGGSMLASPPIDPPPPPPIDPPVDPPPPAESEFMRAVVLDQGFGGSRFRIPVVVQSEPINPFGKSCGGLVDFQYNEPPSMASVMSMRDDVNTIVQFYSRGPTALGVLFGKTKGGWDGFDVVVDDLTNRRAVTAWGYDAKTETFIFWVDGVVRGMKQVPGGIGFTIDYMPALILNSTAGSHQPGDLSPIRLVYAVGAAPTQADVDALSGIVPKPAGFSNGVTDGIAWTEINGPESSLPWTDPMNFLDGKFLFGGKQVVNNPPRQKRWEFPIPGDVGREVSK
jgi:hypothetical protein